MIVIELPGEPRGKGRPRFTRRSGIAFTPAETRSYEGMLRFAAAQATRGKPAIDGPVMVRVEAYFSIPKSWSKRKQGAAMCGMLKHTTKPDADNILKMLDAFNDILWIDDSQIFEATIVKAYSDRARLRVVIEPYLTLIGV